MKKLLLLFLASFSMLFLGGCVIEEGYTGVAVSRGGYYSPGYYDDGYASDIGYYDDGPYYQYGGRRYYNSGGRYLYYVDRRPVYVANLPYGARYITPQQRNRNQVAVNNYKVQQNQYRYATKQQEWQNQAKINQYQYQQKQQQSVNQQKINRYQGQQQQQQWANQQKINQWKYQQAQSAAKYKKQKKGDE